MKPLRKTVPGAGIVGLRQAYTLAYRGHGVRLVERTATPFTNSASQLAGAMLSPNCGRESSERIIEELGVRGVEMWRATFPEVANAGSLVVALARDRAELAQFANRTTTLDHLRNYLATGRKAPPEIFSIPEGHLVG